MDQGTMAKKSKVERNRRRHDRYCYVVLRLWERYLNPEEITKKLNITPDGSWMSGVVRDKNGETIRRKNGTAIKKRYGQWNLEAHVHENSGLEARIQNILEQIRPKRKILKRILKNVNADLKIVVHPNEYLAIAGYVFSGELLNEFTSLGIDIQFAIEMPL